MKLIELHILQSFPVSCLNRDDVGSPKSAQFGGVRRARISSQCLKRASRLLAHKNHPGVFEGIRTRHLIKPFHAALIEAGLDEDSAKANSEELCSLFSKVDSKDPNQVTTAVYLSPDEIKQIASAISKGEAAKKAIKSATRKDAADIAMFGRMVANDPGLNIEGAAMFSHALSTHSADNEIDFFSAVDDGKGEAEDAGAGMIGSLEFNSATYYRYIGINVDLLRADTHLGGLAEDERQIILRSFIKAVLMAVPGARKNSMNAATRPFEVLGFLKESGQPLQLVNAFENPVRANGKGFGVNSLQSMKTHLEDIERIWGKQAEPHYLSDEGLEKFLENIVQ